MTKRKKKNQNWREETKERERDKRWKHQKAAFILIKLRVLQWKPFFLMIPEIMKWGLEKPTNPFDFIIIKYFIKKKELKKFLKRIKFFIFWCLMMMKNSLISLWRVNIIPFLHTQSILMRRMKNSFVIPPHTRFAL